MHHCDQFDGNLSDGEIGLIYIEKFDEVGLKVNDGGSSFIKLAYCPWCGAKLPESRREEWFRKLRAEGINDPFLEDVPERFRTSAWYRS